MFPGLNPKKMQAMMKQLGIAQEEVSANRVIIEKEGGNIIIENPNIVKINMQGQTNFQISGDIVEQESNEDEEEQTSEQEKLEQDIQTIAEKTGCDKDVAAIELEKCNGDIAQAIINLSN